MRLELRNVSAAYGDAVALRGVDLVVPHGSVVALLGPNGAGKTTLLGVASGLLRPRTGEVLVEGVDHAGRSPESFLRAGICHITEGRSVFPQLTVKDNLRMFSPTRHEAEAIERATAAFPKLRDRLQQVAGTLSGGEQQMLALARAYARRSPIVLLDEVSLGLSPIIVDEVFAFLGCLAAEETSLLIVEQYVARALALADYAYVLARSQMVFAGDPRELERTDIFAHYLGTGAGV